MSMDFLDNTEDEELEEEEQLDDLEEENNEEQSNLGEQNNVEDPATPSLKDVLKMSGPIKKATSEAKKEAIKLLLKSPYFWIIVGVVLFLLVVALLVFQMDFDLHGIGEPRPELYSAPACGKVILTWENDSYTTARRKDEPGYNPLTDGALVTNIDEEDENYGKRYSYEEYDYDTYVTNIVWVDNNEAKDVDNSIVYEAMGIAARSRLMARLPDNCVILKNYDEQAKSFKKLQGNEPKYKEILDAVKLSKGLIIGRGKKAIDALYDAFSYTKKKLDNEENKNSYFYHMMNKNEEKYHVIPADWVDELEKKKGVKIPKNRVMETKYLQSFSLYGAKYLLELTDSQYEIYRILETYYGRDIEYYTVDYVFSSEYIFNPDCSDIGMKNTSLTKEEFVSLAKSYASRRGSAKALADQAEMIYDMGISNGVNPELVFIRADVEGYSPGASHNNYWGIGCTNTGGLAACKSYSSLAEGVSGFLKYVSQFGTLTELTGKYAYLGSYWYNPGGSGVGGCYYAPYIYQTVPDRVKEACSSAHPCTTAHEGTCVLTNAEDKQAYLVYQSQVMIKARKSIFNLDAEGCSASLPIGEPGKGNCTIWRQGDPRWGSKSLGGTKSTMAGSGCAVTAVTIAISCSGTTINNVANFNPGTFVDYMNKTGGFTGALIYWDNKAIHYFAPDFKYVTQGDLEGTINQKLDVVRSKMSDNTSILLYFKNEEHQRGHYVVLKSINGSKLTVYDPANGKVNEYDAAGLKGYVLYRF